MCRVPIGGEMPARDCAASYEKGGTGADRRRSVSCETFLCCKVLHPPGGPGSFFVANFR